MKKEYCNYEEFADLMYSTVDTYGEMVYAVVFYEDVKELVKELLLYEDVNLCACEFEPEDYDGYTKEYYVILTENLELSVEKAWHEKNEYHPACYFGIGDGVVLLSSDANSVIMKNCTDCTFIEVEIIPDDDGIEDDTDDEDNNDEECFTDEELEAVGKICELLKEIFY